MSGVACLHDCYCDGVDHTLLSLVDIEVGILQQFADDRLDVFTDVARLRQRRTVTDGKRHVKTPRQDLRQERLSYRQQSAITAEDRLSHTGHCF